MKRFTAYLSILISVILGVIIVALPTVQGIDGGFDYGTDTREFVYQIVQHDETIDDFDEKYFDDKPEAVKEIADEFESRLIDYGVEKYNIVTEGNDKIRVTLSAKNDTEYGYINSYLQTDGNLSLATFDGEYVFNNFEDTENGDSTVMFGKKDAYLTYKNSIYPGIVIPLEDAKLFNEKAVEHAKSLNKPSEDGSKPVSQEGNIYLWQRYDRDHDTFDAAQNNINVRDKLMLSFQYDSIWFEEKEEDRASIVFYFNVEGLDQNSTFADINWNAVAKATDQANYYLHLVNANHMKYKAYELYNTRVPGAVLEPLLNDNMPAMSQTLLATVVTFVLALLICGVWYRLSGVTTILTGSFGVLLTLLIYNGLGATFSFPALIGFVLISVLMYINSALHSHKLSLEIKKGKNAKKAFEDSTRKVNWYTLDLSLLTLFTGAIVYLLGNSYLQGLGIILFFGSLINLIIQFVINKPALYFLSTSSVGANKIALFSNYNKEQAEADTSDPEAVKENIEESKEKFEKTMHKKPKTPFVAGIAMGVVALACALGLGIAAGVSTPYAEKSAFNQNNYAYIYVEEDDKTLDESALVNAKLKTIGYQIDENTIVDVIDYGKDSEGKETFKDSIKRTEYTYYTNPTESENSIEFTTYIYTIKLSSKINAQDLITLAEEGKDAPRKFIATTLDAEGKKVAAEGAEPTTLEDALKGALSSDSTKVTINSLPTDAKGHIQKLDLTKTYNLDSIALVTYISILVCSVYMLVRYGRHVALMNLTITSATSTIALGVFSILRTPVFNYIAFATIPVALITMFILALASVRLKENFAETKVKNMDSEYKIKVAKESELDVKAYAAYIGIAAVAILICYFGFSTPLVANTFLLAFFMAIIAYMFIAVIYVPYYVRLEDKFGNMNLKLRLPKSKKKRLKAQHKARQKGKEVEEATFIGIND